MTRISSFGQSNLLLQNTLRNQERLFIAQEQITTGKKASSFQELSPKVQESLSARQTRAAIGTFRTTIQSIRQTIGIYDTQLTTVTNATRDLKEAMVIAVGQEDGTGFRAQIEQAFELVTSALNTRLNGNFIFGGAQIDQPPVSVATLTDLQALPTSDDAFQNDSAKSTALIAEGIAFTFGQVADDVADEIMASFRRLADFDTGPSGPFDGKLTPAQRAFLETEIGNIEQAIQKAQGAQTRNGLNSNRLDVVDEQHAASELFIEQLVSDIEDVNLAEAISRLTQDQTALEASFQAIGTLSRLSLLNFL